jgi:phenylpyruvate tautomerase PptA (4-oxalocrotonate tautomerase family)
LVIHFEKDDLSVTPEKQALIDRITNASPEQLSKIQSIVDLVMQS